MILFLQWFWDRFGVHVIITMFMIGLFLGIPILFVDIVPSLEGFRFGWFYRLVHIPSLACLGGLSLTITVIIAQSIVEWFVQQINDWNEYQSRHK